MHVGFGEHAQEPYFLPGDVVVTALRRVAVLDPVDVAAPPDLAEVVGELVPVLLHHDVDVERGDIPGEGPVEVEEHRANGSLVRLSRAVLKPEAQCDDTRPVNPLLLGAVVAALVVAVIATIAAIRAGNRARRAAALVSQLLEPVEVTDMVFPGGSPATTDGHGDAARRRPADRSDRNAARIPVLDLDRLRVWLTEGDVEMGRIAVVSVEIDNLASVYERLGARAGVELVESITQRLRTLTRPRDVVAHVNQDRFVLVCRDVPDRAAAEALSQRVALGVSHPSVLVAGVAEVSASIGVALAAGNEERPQSVLKRAVEAGKRARGLGGGRVEIAPTVAYLAAFGR